MQRTSAKAGRMQEDVRSNTKLLLLMVSISFMRNSSTIENNKALRLTTQSQLTERAVSLIFITTFNRVNERRAEREMVLPPYYYATYLNYVLPYTFFVISFLIRIHHLLIGSIKCCKSIPKLNKSNGIPLYNKKRGDSNNGESYNKVNKTY